RRSSLDERWCGGLRGVEGGSGHDGASRRRRSLAERGARQRDPTEHHGYAGEPELDARHRSVALGLPPLGGRRRRVLVVRRGARRQRRRAPRLRTRVVYSYWQRYFTALMTLPHDVFVVATFGQLIVVESPKPL